RNGEALIRDSVRVQILRNGVRALFRQRLILLSGSRAISVAGDIYHRLVVLLQYECDRVKDAEEARIKIGTPAAEGDISGHHEIDGVTTTGHRNATTLQLCTKLRFLTIHVVPDRATR